MPSLLAKANEIIAVCQNSTAAEITFAINADERLMVNPAPQDLANSRASVTLSPFTDPATILTTLARIDQRDVR